MIYFVSPSLTSSFDMGEISAYDKIIIKNLKKRQKSKKEIFFANISIKKKV